MSKPRVPVWWSSAAALAKEIRGSCDLAWVDPTSVAVRLGVDVVEDELTAMGLAVNSTTVLVRNSLSHDLKRLTIAHELAHVLVCRGRCSWVAHSDEERFCDAFARELLVPALSLRGIQSADVERTARLVEVSPDTILLQLAVLGVVEPLIITDSGRVLCVACGDRNRLRACACASAHSGSTEGLPVYAAVVNRDRNDTAA